MEKKIIELLSSLGVPVSLSHFETIIKSHPDYPSLLSIADSLDRVGIGNIAGVIDKNKLNEIPYPFLLQLNTRHKDIIAIKNDKDLTVHHDSIKNYWEGTVLQVDQSITQLKTENQIMFKKELFTKRIKTILLGVVLIFLVLLFLISTDFAMSILLSSSIVGTLVGYLLLAKEMGVKYETVENFCGSGKGKGNGCDAVLNSDGAKLFGFLSLSTIVFSFFLAQTVCLAASVLFGSAASSLLSPLAYLSAFSMSAIVYSVYYQWKIEKAWCKLCLTVDGILAFQALLFFATHLREHFLPQEIQLASAAAAISTLAILGGAIFLVKEKLESLNDLKEKSLSAARVKNNVKVFNHFLKNQDELISSLSECEIQMGNPAACIQLIMVSNLHCNPCKEMHGKLDELVNDFRDKISVILKFVRTDSNEYLVRYWLSKIHGQPDEAMRTQQLLHDWYQVMNLEKFKSKFTLSEEDQKLECGSVLNQHNAFMEREGILRTPTLFLNEYLLPREYSLKDLYFLIPSLIEEKRITVAKTEKILQETV